LKYLGRVPDGDVIGALGLQEVDRRKVYAGRFVISQEQNIMGIFIQSVSIIIFTIILTVGIEYPILRLIQRIHMGTSTDPANRPARLRSRRSVR
jgi:hypothetical protein